MPLSDILACPQSQLEEIIAQDEAYELGTWFFAKNIGAIELSQLGELLGLGSYDNLMAGFQLVGEPLPEGPWPQTIPLPLVERLAAITDEEIGRATAKWSRIAEFDGAATPEGLATYLQGLRAFLAANPAPFFLVSAL